jgi:pimeloyl-ACP methyl ester carboxylesterase
MSNARVRSRQAARASRRPGRSRSTRPPRAKCTEGTAEHCSASHRLPGGDRGDLAALDGLAPLKCSGQPTSEEQRRRNTSASGHDDLRVRLDAIDHLVPTLMIQGGADFCDPPSESAGLEHHFDTYRRIVLDGVGHFPHREAPDTVGRMLLDQFGRS